MRMFLSVFLLAFMQAQTPSRPAQPAQPQPPASQPSAPPFMPGARSVAGPGPHPAFIVAAQNGKCDGRTIKLTAEDKSVWCLVP